MSKKGKIYWPLVFWVVIITLALTSCQPLDPLLEPSTISGSDGENSVSTSQPIFTPTPQQTLTKSTTPTQETILEDQDNVNVVLEPLLSAVDCLAAGVPEMACTGVASNDEWAPVIREFGGIPMVLVPAGCFTMGSTAEQIEQYLTMMDVPAFYQDEQPAHTQCIQEPFWIDIYEVTNGYYGSYGIWRESDQPRESVTWFEANTYCTTRGGHLPSEVEWEYAARGPDNLIYPWGNTFDGNRLNYCDTNCQTPGRDPSVDDGYAIAAPVGSYPDGASWVGALDMAGNVWEWINTSLQPYPYRPDDGREVNPEELDPTSTMMLRGGGRLDPNYVVRSAQRNERKAHYYDSRFGLRCARSFDPKSDGQIAAEEPPEMIMEPPTSARLGDTWTRPFDGAVMVFVPGGTFQMGSTTDQAESPGLNEYPEHPVHVDNFWIDKYPIDNKQFAEFLYLRGNQLEDGVTWYDGESDYSLLEKRSDFFKPYLGFEHHPTINVSWYGAQAYCESIGGRLLTEAEWEYAASGPENRTFPWGNEYDCEMGNFQDCRDGESDSNQCGCDEFEFTSPVGAFPEGASWVGVLDLAGNVGDWVADWGIAPYPAGLQTNPTGPEFGTMKIVRGGSWDSYGWGVRTSMRENYNPSERSPLIGFRCAYSARP